MNAPRNRLRVLTSLVMLCLVGGDGWALWQLSASQQQLDLERDQLLTANRIAQSIESLRRSPEKLDATARSAETLAKLIESAAQGVGLSTDRIVHVAPSEPRRIGNTPYLEQTTAVELREVSLKQVVDLTQAVAQIAPRLSLPSISVRMPPSEANTTGGPELWNVEMTLTGHLYEPKMPASNR